MIKVGEEGVGEGEEEVRQVEEVEEVRQVEGVEEEQTLEVGEVVEVAL